MRAVVPNEFDNTMITATNVATNEYTEWAAGSYNRGDYVQQNFRVYRSAIDANTDDPTGFEVGVNADPPTWVFMGYANYLRAFTEGRDTITTKAGADLDFTINYGADVLIETVGLLNVGGADGFIEVIDDVEGVVATRTFEVLDTSSSDWWEYLFTGYDETKDHTFSGLPPYIGASLRVVIQSADGTSDTSLGRLVAGVSNKIGDIQEGTATVGRRRFRRYERDGFGNLVSIPRRNIKRSSYDVIVDNARVDSVQGYFDIIESTPTLFIGIDDETGYSNSLAIFGFFVDFDISIEYYNYSICSIEIEGY